MLRRVCTVSLPAAPPESGVALCQRFQTYNNRLGVSIAVLEDTLHWLLNQTELGGRVPTQSNRSLVAYDLMRPATLAQIIAFRDITPSVTVAEVLDDTWQLACSQPQGEENEDDQGLICGSTNLFLASDYGAFATWLPRTIGDGWYFGAIATSQRLRNSHSADHIFPIGTRVFERL